MLEILQHFQEPWAIRALLASSMVGLMCGVLGSFIVLRNMALIGDALAHAILPGVVLAFVIVGGYSTLGFFAGSVIAGLFAAVGITWIQQNVKTKNDAAIGIVFTAMFAIGVIGISKISRQPGVHLDLVDFLFGKVLGVSNEDLYLTAAVMVFVFASIIIFYRHLFVATFQPVIAETMGISVKTIHYFLMLLLSFAVVASLRTVGLILVVAMLITPAATALLLSNRLHWVITLSGIIGLFSAIIGLIVSIAFDLTPGPAMAVVATLFYVLAAFFAPQRGLVFKYFQKRKLRVKIQMEDILKQTFRLQQSDSLNIENLLGRLGFKKATLINHLSILRHRNLVEKDSLVLTKEGLGAARKLVRAHRLWETYLVDKVGLSAEQIHEDAEKYEHLLTEEILDEVDRTLGYPALDPHGSPIPTKQGMPEFPLINLEILQKAKIAQKQMSEHISSKLWQLGLLPEMSFSIQKKDENVVEIEQAGKRIELPSELAQKVNIII